MAGREHPKTDCANYIEPLSLLVGKQIIHRIAEQIQKIIQYIISSLQKKKTKIIGNNQPNTPKHLYISD